jgi:predicted SAM-dependent methyltransferase
MLKYLYYGKVYFIQSKLELVLNKKKYEKKFSPFHENFSDKRGIEIGGPSGLFASNIMPIYELAQTIDGCNFSSNTVWEGNITSEQYRYFKEKTGKQFISEGSDLSYIGDEEYDFVLSCHNLEHFANPVKAVKEWYRILKKGGTMLLVLPDKRFTFDNKREYTSFDHLVNDFIQQTPETDLTHMEEILQFHDMKLDPPLKNDFEAFRKRCENNFNNRCMHHHVYSQDLLDKVFKYAGIQTIGQFFVPPIHQVIIGKK